MDCVASKTSVAGDGIVIMLLTKYVQCSNVKQAPALALSTPRLVVQTRTTLRSHAHNILVRRRIRPDNIKVIIRVGRRIFVPKSINNIRQSIMFPANQNIAGSIIAFHGVSDAVRVVAVAVRVDREAEVFCERLNGLVGAGAFAA